MAEPAEGLSLAERLSGRIICARLHGRAACREPHHNGRGACTVHARRGPGPLSGGTKESAAGPSPGANSELARGPRLQRAAPARPHLLFSAPSPPQRPGLVPLPAHAHRPVWLQPRARTTERRMADAFFTSREWPRRGGIFRGPCSVFSYVCLVVWGGQWCFDARQACFGESNGEIASS